MILKNCWLSNFNKEYINADFNHSGKRIHKKKMVKRKITYTGKIREFDVGKKDCENANNRRNNDIFSITKCNGMMKGEKELIKGLDSNRSTNFSETEDTLITLLDAKKLLKS